jgi:hypothetical protein
LPALLAACSDEDKQWFEGQTIVSLAGCLRVQFEVTTMLPIKP